MNKLKRNLLIIALMIASVAVLRANVNQPAGSSAAKITIGDSVEVTLLFELNLDVLDVNFASNREEMQKLSTFVEKMEDPSTLKIHVNVASSPEGKYAYNATLSHKRAITIEKYLRELVGKRGLTLSSNELIINEIAENWAGLIREVKASTEVPSKEKVLEVICNNDLSDVAKEARLRTMDGGIPWKFLRDKILIKIRSAEVNIVCYCEKIIVEPEPEPVPEPEPEPEPVIIPPAPTPAPEPAPEPEKKHRRRWDVFAYAGISSFHGFRGAPDSYTDHDIAPEVKVGFDYYCKPWLRIGLGAGYTKLTTLNNQITKSTEKIENYKVGSYTATLNRDIALLVDRNEEHILDIDATIDFNFLDIWPRRKANRLNMWMGTGIGVMKIWNYMVNTYSVSEEAVTQGSEHMCIYSHDYIKTDSWNKDDIYPIYIPLNLALEYEITPCFTLGVQGHYKWMPQDILYTPEGMWGVGAIMRFNF